MLEYTQPQHTRNLLRVEWYPLSTGALHYLVLKYSVTPRNCLSVDKLLLGKIRTCWAATLVQFSEEVNKVLQNVGNSLPVDIAYISGDLVWRDVAVKTKNLANNTQSRNSALFAQPEVRRCIHNRPPLIPILGMMKVVYTRTSQFLNMRFNIILIFTPVLHLFFIQIYKQNMLTVRISVSLLMHNVRPCHLLLIFFVTLNYEGQKILSFLCLYIPHPFP